MFPAVVAVGALAAILFLSRSASAQTNDSTQPEAGIPPPLPIPGNTGGFNLANLFGSATKLAGQGTVGGTTAKNPTAAVRTAGAVAAGTGVVSWLQGRSNIARTASGAQTGVGVATAFGASLGPATLGISAGIGAVVGFVAGINRNDTKEARLDFAKGNGYPRNGGGFDQMIRVDLAKVIGTQRAEALWNEAVNRIGRKDNAWNDNWIGRIVAAFQGQAVPAYLNDPTKGAAPVL